MKNKAVRPFKPHELDRVRAGRSYGPADGLVRRLLLTIDQGRPLEEKKVAVDCESPVLSLLRQLVARLVAWEEGENPPPGKTRYVIQPTMTRVWTTDPDRPVEIKSSDDWYHIAYEAAIEGAKMEMKEAKTVREYLEARERLGDLKGESNGSARAIRRRPAREGSATQNHLHGGSDW